MVLTESLLACCVAVPSSVGSRRLLLIRLRQRQTVGNTTHIWAVAAHKVLTVVPTPARACEFKHDRLIVGDGAIVGERFDHRCAVSKGTTSPGHFTASTATGVVSPCTANSKKYRWWGRYWLW